MIWIIFFITSIFSSLAFARGEYATRYGFVNCTVCHMNPSGGGIRTPQGKQFGAHELRLAKISQKVDWMQLDYRVEAFQSKSASTRKGLLVMTTSPSASIPVVLDENEPAAVNIVISYGLGRLENGLENSYLRYNLNPGESTPWFEHLMVGRFVVPFGLLSDEHRMFVKMAVPATMQVVDYQNGFMLSGTPSYSFHYDLALTSGRQGDSPVADESPWGAILNLRSLPFQGPLLLGMSFSKTGTGKTRVQPEAFDLYAIYSVKKATLEKVPLTLIAETNWNQGWNNSTLNSRWDMFFPTTSSSATAWKTALAEARAQAILLQAQWDLSSRWQLLYRQEVYTPDINYSGDSYYRYGYGLKYFFSGNSSLVARYEQSLSTRPGISEDGTAQVLGNTAYMLLHFWL